MSSPNADQTSEVPAASPVVVDATPAASPTTAEEPKKPKAPKAKYVANWPFPLRAIGTVWAGTCIVSGWFVIWLLQWASKALTFPFTTKDQRTDICSHIMRRVSTVTAMWLNPMWRMTILKPLPSAIKDHKKVIFVMNHLSNADPWVMAAAMLPYEARWICKGDLFDVPIGGWALANAGDLKVEFTKEKGGWGVKKGTIGKMMAQAKEYINSGRIVAVFPEGARNPNPHGPIGEFKLGFFNLAHEIGATIIPVALSGTEGMWGLTEVLFDSSRAYVSMGEPITLKEGETAEELRDRCLNVIIEMRSEHPDVKARALKAQKAL